MHITFVIATSFFYLPFHRSSLLRIGPSLFRVSSAFFNPSFSFHPHASISLPNPHPPLSSPPPYNTHLTPDPGETIPIRLFLGGFDLTPTFRDVNKKFSTRYYLNLVLIDEENRRYFKQQEITIYRIPEVSFGC